MIKVAVLRYKFTVSRRDSYHHYSYYWEILLISHVLGILNKQSVCKLFIYYRLLSNISQTLHVHLARGWMFTVGEVDLALLRNPEEIATDTQEFMNNGEWELLSVPSHYWKLNLANKDYAHIQFNVSVDLQLNNNI